MGRELVGEPMNMKLKCRPVCNGTVVGYFPLPFLKMSFSKTMIPLWGLHNKTRANIF